MTGLLHISDRLLAGESSRVEAARGTLYPLSNIEIRDTIAGEFEFFVKTEKTLDRYS